MLQKFSGIRKVYENEGEGGEGRGGKDGVSRAPVEDLLSHITEKHRTGTLRRFKFFGYGKLLCITGVYHNLPPKVF